MILSNARTLNEDLEYAKLNGYNEEFIFSNDQLINRNNQKLHDKTECTLVEYCYREEGTNTSDPTILFLIQCSDNTKGSLTCSDKTYADAQLIEFAMGLDKVES